MTLASKEGCDHPTTTLVQVQDPEFGWFACFQCDKCGTITQQPVSPHQLEEASNAPWLDEDSYQRATMERSDVEIDWLALQFMVKAVKAPVTTGKNGYR